MNIKDTIKWLGLHASTVQRYIASQRSVSRSSIDLLEECTLPMQHDLCNKFPIHTRTIIIQVIPKEDGTETLTANMVGSWNGKYWRIASRRYNQLYGRYVKALRSGKDSTVFRTQPTQAEIRAMTEEDAAREAIEKAKQLAAERIAEENVVEERQLIVDIKNPERFEPPCPQEVAEESIPEEPKVEFPKPPEESELVGVLEVAVETKPEPEVQVAVIKEKTEVIQTEGLSIEMPTRAVTVHDVNND